ncbi:MAG TPA: Hsp20/alpha crystallin family protein [Elusimicrobiales bacterium]|nr:Hsp20/alpha crystallin family protein [Elusimicrobiales bacterium]
MREKYLWLAIIVLVILTLGQACFIYGRRAAAQEMSGHPPIHPEIWQQAHSEQAAESQREELEKWRGKVRRQIDRGVPLLEPDFDDFFNDRFFARRLNPFGEMERIRRQISESMPGRAKDLFDGYWDGWFAQRMRMEEFKTTVVNDGSRITIAIDLPGPAARSAEVDISEGRIKISFSAKAASGANSGGAIIKKGSSQSYIKILPVPEEAESGTGVSDVTGGQLRITFERKKIP